ncbi:nucleoside phosphorylase domain-containing protein [Gymnopilus junonius]|uniref:Nucleoside phosphorylase domain-containing protein n=1 Tax=Gymnopilus junonius TaxID=109634 RepID=A0A9P5NJ94_GYMJU|nr:nucleoside phosphorylase domain-containing protein [Gymnopilus junonius]
MKDLLTDANFPRTADQRVYHLGVRPGEVANRIVTVGSPSRANTIASFLDAQPKPFVLNSERGFLTITGRYKGTPISIVSIGMGNPNMDFFVREIKETVTGDLAIVRLGSCGALIDVPPATVVVPKASVAITRNFDFDFASPENSDEAAYKISKPVSADDELTAEVIKALQAGKPSGSASAIITGTVNASADSFYSSQGRQTSFPDHNSHLIEHLQEKVENLATLEMETFHLFHLAACWVGRTVFSQVGSTPLTTGPVIPVIESSSPTQHLRSAPPPLPNSVIRAAATHMVFASRKSKDFINPQQVEEVENWTAQGILNALFNIQIPEDRLHASEGSVWELV